MTLEVIFYKKSRRERFDVKQQSEDEEKQTATVYVDGRDIKNKNCLAIQTGVLKREGDKNQYFCELSNVVHAYGQKSLAGYSVEYPEIRCHLYY